MDSMCTDSPAVGDCERRGFVLDVANTCVSTDDVHDAYWQHRPSFHQLHVSHVRCHVRGESRRRHDWQLHGNGNGG